MINQYGVAYLSAGELRRVIDTLPDDAYVSLGYWTDLGVPEHPAFTTCFAKDWVVTEYDEGVKDLSIRSMTLEELYPKIK